MTLHPNWFTVVLLTMNVFFPVCLVVANSGVVLSLEEVEVGLKGLKVQPEPAQPLPQRQLSGGGGTPFMAEHLEEALTGGARGATKSRDPDMSAFNKLVSSMKASGTLPTHHIAGGSNVSVPPRLRSPVCVCTSCMRSSVR